VDLKPNDIRPSPIGSEWPWLSYEPWHYSIRRDLVAESWKNEITKKWIRTLSFWVLTNAPREGLPFSTLQYIYDNYAGLLTVGCVGSSAKGRPKSALLSMRKFGALKRLWIKLVVDRLPHARYQWWWSLLSRRRAHQAFRFLRIPLPKIRKRGKSGRTLLEIGQKVMKRPIQPHTDKGHA
jgi:hypothetical protein